jgi:radical SAM protein with 4Fe4S-binding SPASM domain
MIVLEMSNLCNLNCIHCPYGKLNMTENPNRNKRFLDMDDFVRIIASLAEAKERSLLRFVGDGEPMFHPNILEMIHIAKRDTNCLVSITTNGTLLGDEEANMLLASKIDVIDISIDALTKKTYETVRRNGNFEQLLQNIFRLIAMRNENYQQTKIMVNFIRQKENESESETFRAFWSQIVDYVIIRSLHSAARLVTDKVREALSQNTVAGEERYPCPHLWKRLVVNTKGSVRHCATDFWGDNTVIGNVKENSLAEIWHGNHLRELRKQHEGNSITDDNCRDCIDWLSTRWDYGYEKIIDNVMGNTWLTQ